MFPKRLSARTALPAMTALVAAVLAFTLVAPNAAAASATPRPVTVKPSALHLGTAPQVAWYQRAKNQIVRAGHRTTHVPFSNQLGSRFYHAGDGWLAQNAVGSGNRFELRFLGTNGRVRTVHPTSTWQLDLVASDGKTFVEHRLDYQTPDPTLEIYRIVRVRDGHVLQTRSFEHDVVTLVSVEAMSPTRVVMSVARRTGGGKGTSTVDFWDSRTGRVDTFQERQTRWAGGGPTPAHLEAHVIGARDSNGVGFRDSRTGRVLWRPGTSESVMAFSPNGGRAVTVADSDGYRELDTFWHRLQIRDAQTGRVQATFRGYFDNQISWESDGTVLVMAYDGPTRAHPQRLGKPVLVRCSVGGSCQRVGGGASIGDLTVRRSG